MNLFRYRARHARRVAVCAAALGVALAGTAADTKTAKRRPPAVSVAQARADREQTDVMPHKQFFERWVDCFNAKGSAAFDMGKDDLQTADLLPAACSQERADLRRSLTLVMPPLRADKVIARIDAIFADQLSTAFLKYRVEAIDKAGPRTVGAWKLYPIRYNVCLASYEALQQKVKINYVRWEGPVEVVIQMIPAKPMAASKGTGTIDLYGAPSRTPRTTKANWVAKGSAVQWTFEIGAQDEDFVMQLHQLVLSTHTTLDRIDVPPTDAAVWVFLQECSDPRDAKQP
ncbi:hypothetical protein [Sphingomonas zeae]|uniref:DUF2927 domain-containing protein n=1 Tax=Sphingomonas zeae TaxID=1646122 RepID=A0A7Y6EFJ5_9SPHN|nr:hypothetical protein [Sphingomonas zeae]MBB4050180.1 hypothetical protein [Sphingomonas zeae]NUU45440.1 hypothetical protein [Sphingomonas zeae]